MKQLLDPRPAGHLDLPPLERLVTVLDESFCPSWIAGIFSVSVSIKFTQNNFEGHWKQLTQSKSSKRWCLFLALFVLFVSLVRKRKMCSESFKTRSRCASNTPRSPFDFDWSSDQKNQKLLHSACKFLFPHSTMKQISAVNKHINEMNESDWSHLQIRYPLSFSEDGSLWILSTDTTQYDNYQWLQLAMRMQITHSAKSINDF